MDGRTDGRTDGQTDTASYSDARTHLKIGIAIYRVFPINCDERNQEYSASRRDKLILKKVLSRYQTAVFSCKISSN